MRKLRIIVVLLLGTFLLTGMACSQTTWDLNTIVDGQGDVSPSTGTFSDGDVITLTATPASGWEFSHWGGHGSGAGNPLTMSMDSDKTVYAYFVEIGGELTPTPTASPTEANPTQTATSVSAPNSISPHNGAHDVGTLADNMVSVQLKWSDVDAVVYEWQVDDECGFSSPMVSTGVTSETVVTITNLEPSVSYCWRVKAKEPSSGWSTSNQFSTVSSN